jgi:ATP-dependent helicase Lhr and Lhr-like helicase
VAVTLWCVEKLNFRLCVPRDLRPAFSIHFYPRKSRSPIRLGQHPAVTVAPPHGVSSLKQRLGRSGRKESDARVLRVYLESEELDAQSNLFEHLQLPLVQSVAVIELVLEKWIEPPMPPACDLSTLTHQIISVISQTGGARADRLFDDLCRKGAFRDVEASLFARLLRNLAERDVIEQMPEGDLILGLKGEALRKTKDFYAVFPTAREFAVYFEAQRIGNGATFEDRTRQSHF